MRIRRRVVPGVDHHRRTLYRSGTPGAVGREVQSRREEVGHEVRVHLPVLLLDLLDGGGHDAEVAPQLLGHVQDLVLVVENVHSLSVGVVAHTEWSLNIVGDVSDKLINK